MPHAPGLDPYPSPDEYDRLLALICPPGAKCWLCGEPVIYGLRRWHPYGPSLDHIIPRSKGGLWVAENLKPAHFGHNAGRGNRAPTSARGRRSRDW